MTILSDRITEGGFPRMNDALGATVTYTTAAGAASAVSGVISRDSERDMYAADGSYVMKAATVIVASASVTAPAIGDTITWDSIVWNIVAVNIGADKSTFELSLEFFDRKRVARESHFIKR